ncbi:MAG: pyruvate:ferredoxin (flavodoxin) oxidoreductase, partial [Clostridiales bacterium]|nr:pyruvate:ferredoxin (flavodoxin) oxidoreductase [Clostridiales bacterium]
CRQAGFAMLSSGSVQEVMDLGGIAHLSAIEASLPFMHFFDGFRTSHEIQKIDCIDYEDFAKLLNWEAVEKFRKKALNPEHPVLRSTVQNPDIYFQVREAAGRFYCAIPGIVEKYMESINAITGRDYGLFDYYGAQDADRVIIAMGSVSGAIKETVDWLNSKGEKTGFVNVHLFRPFSTEHLIAKIPGTVKKIAVLDRLMEAGAAGEPLYTDVCTAYVNKGVRPMIYGGRYGLSSKDTSPAQIKAVYDNLSQAEPKDKFTIGIVDDVTGRSLDAEDGFFIEDPGTKSCKFWGLGSDGTVGANKNSVKIIGEYTDMYTQSYFEYDTKKSFGITKSHLRFGNNPIRSTYLVKNADFIACHNQTYLHKYEIIEELKKGGTFLLNCDFALNELDDKIPASIRRHIAENDIKFYIIDANKIAQEEGLGNFANMVLQSAFFKLAGIIPYEDAVKYMKDGVEKTYGKKGAVVVSKNMAAIDRGASGLVEVSVPAEWRDAEEGAKEGATNVKDDLPDIIKNILVPINAQKGDDLPVSAFIGMEDGTMPLGTSAYEKRGIATDIPVWNAEACLQCNRCSYVCPHAAIRPYLMNEDEKCNAPDEFECVKAKGKLKNYHYTLQVSALDCASCGCCALECPAKGKALVMKPIAEAEAKQGHWEYGLSISEKAESLSADVKGTQFKKPLLEFSGACSGCGETTYIKLLTQLFGDKMYFANGTGCTQAWGSAMPCVPYTVTGEGRGPAWSNSLFENNAEFSLGMCLAVAQQRSAVRDQATELLSIAESAEVKGAVEAWLDNFSDLEGSQKPSRELVSVLEATKFEGRAKELADVILLHKDQLTKKTMWMVGGDGWAYDIGYGGLDHVFASGEDVNVLVVDTEVYSNTGGQSSKATPLGAVAQFASSGKKSSKKDLGRLMMTYGNVYVAQVSMGADRQQVINALIEAEKHPGPAIVIAYAPCINHGIKAGMGTVQAEMKRAVDSGYWNLYRYDPKDKEKPFTLDSKEPSLDYREFLEGEVRYSSLELAFPDNAKELFEKAKEEAKERYEIYRKLAEN